MYLEESAIKTHDKHPGSNQDLGGSPECIDMFFQLGHTGIHSEDANPSRRFINHHGSIDIDSQTSWAADTRDYAYEEDYVFIGFLEKLAPCVESRTY
jgi:hypothetical protein